MNTKSESDVGRQERDLSGLENMFREVVINSGGRLRHGRRPSKEGEEGRG